MTSMDYRRFLARTETVVLPYFGGTRVDAVDRRLRIADAGDDDRAPGWYSFTVEGRKARFGEPAEPADVSRLPAVRGHVAGGYLFSSGREVERFALAPREEPEPLAPCTGRRWYGGELLFDAIEFEDDAEMSARAALESLAPIDGVKGVAPSLRAAYAFAVLDAVGREVEIPVSPRESTGHVGDIAAGGRDAAEAVLRALAERRRAYMITLAARRAVPRSVRAVPTPHRRADDALEAAGARMVRARQLDDWRMEVHFDFMGERFISVVDAHSLHVYDSGICLSGADEELTLESLPSAIREAIETDQLHITRR